MMMRASHKRKVKFKCYPRNIFNTLFKQNIYILYKLATYAAAAVKAIEMQIQGQNKGVAFLAPLWTSRLRPYYCWELVNTCTWLREISESQSILVDYADVIYDTEELKWRLQPLYKAKMQTLRMTLANWTKTILSARWPCQDLEYTQPKMISRDVDDTQGCVMLHNGLVH